MIRLRTGLPSVFLKPGEAYVGEEPTVVTTVLGSCVSITLFSPRLKLGAICHTILPSGDSRDGDNQYKYVDQTLRRLLGIFDSYGIRRREIEVKLFGGSNMLEQPERREDSRSVGEQNVRKALAVIEEEGLTLISSDTGGCGGRKILFYTHTGQVMLRRSRRRTNEPDMRPFPSTGGLR